MKELIMQLLRNRKLNDKSSLAYILNHINPQIYVYICMCSYKRDELLAKLDDELNEQKAIERVLQLRTFEHLKPVQ